MRVMAQMAMVMNLDKCIGCHTCSVTCKQAWTNRAGTEYVWFNNVETRPGLGYPRGLRGPGRVAGRLGDEERPAAAARRRPAQEAAHHLQQPEDALDPGLLRALDLRLRDPAQRAGPEELPCGAAPFADLGQADQRLVERQLGRRPRRLAGARGQGRHAARHRGQGDVRVRADLHVLPAADLRALPQPVVRGVLPERRDLQARGGRHRPGRPGPLPRLADVHHRLPLQEGLLQPQDRQGREVHLLLPADRGRHPDRVLGDLRGPAALHRAGALRRRQGARGGVGARRHRPLRVAARRLPRPRGPRGAARGRGGRHPR